MEGRGDSGPVTSCLFLFWRMQTICVFQKLVYSRVPILIFNFLVFPLFLSK